MAGLVLSSYFAGFTLGAVRCGRIIERIGHIRGYAAFAGLVVAATAAMPLLVGPVPWLVLRAIVGFGCAGLFVTTESWLNAKARPAERGRVFSIYMVGTFLALALGQLLIGRPRSRPRPVQRHRRPVRRGAGHGEHDPGGAAAATATATLPYGQLPARHLSRSSAARSADSSAAPSTRSFRRGCRTRVSSARRSVVHARGRAWRPRLPDPGRPALGPFRPAHRAGRARPGFAARPSPWSACRARRRWSCRPRRCSAAYVDPLSGLCRPRARPHAGRRVVAVSGRLILVSGCGSVSARSSAQPDGALRPSTACSTYGRRRADT